MQTTIDPKRLKAFNAATLVRGTGQTEGVGCVHQALGRADGPLRGGDRPNGGIRLTLASPKVVSQDDRVGNRATTPHSRTVSMATKLKEMMRLTARHREVLTGFVNLYVSRGAGRDLAVSIQTALNEIAGLKAQNASYRRTDRSDAGIPMTRKCQCRRRGLRKDLESSIARDARLNAALQDGEQ
jgi:hypothetical protein